MQDRAIFKGAIMLGSFPIPIQVIKATKSHDVMFHEYHSTDLGRVGRSKSCKSCGAVLTGADIVKGVEITKGTVVTLTKEELETLPITSTKNIEIDRYVKANEINPLMLESSYYVLPSEDYAVKAFTQFVKGLKKQGRVAIGKVTMRQRENICVLQPVNGGLIMSIMLYANEIRPMPQTPTAKVTEAEVELVTQVINKFAKKFEHEIYSDEYTNAVNLLIDAKLKGKKLATPATPQTKQAPSLSDALSDLLGGKK